MSRRRWMALAIVVGSPLSAMAQPEFSTVPTQAVYQYQLNYQLPWQRWWGGPGLSLGGTMPTQGAFGYSSLNGIPLPAPLGAGVYVNSSAPPPHAVNVPPGMPFGPGPMGMPGYPSGPGMNGGGPNIIPGSFQTQSQPGSNQGQGQQRTPKRAATVSAPGARRASAEQQNQGDLKLRQNLWAQAYVKYKNAVDLAPERPEAHFRMALTFTALKQYSSAIREFKKSIDLDPTLPQSGDTLSTIFGGDVKTWESQVMPVVAAWTQEDLRDTDRLFLLGLLLYFNEDPRGSEMMEAAKRTPGVNDYVLAFTNPAATPLADARQSAPRRRNARPPQPDPNESTIEVTPDETTPGDLPLPPAPAPMDEVTPEPYPLPPPT
jgi:hypothetical protein